MLKSIVLAFALVLGALAGPRPAEAACPSRLFVSGYNSTVHVYDACTGAYLRDLDTPVRIRGAQAVRLGPDGLIYVVSEKSQQILRYRNDTLAFVDVFATLPGADPTGLAFDAAGNVYVAAFRTDDVRRLAPSGAPAGIPVPARAAGLNGPDNGIAFAPDGRLYVPGYYSSSVVRHDPQTGASVAVVASGAQGLVNTRGLLPERDGRGLLITGEGSGQLLRLDFASGAVTVLNAGLARPTGLDFAPDGDLLVLEGARVRRFDPATGAAKGVFIANAAPVQEGTYLAVLPIPGGAGPAATVPVVEFHHAGLDHYFVSSLPADIAALDSGTLKGWTRTGRTFNAFDAPVTGANPVCRFYLPPASGDSHFYSASPDECAEVAAKFPTFVLEASDVMHVVLPDTVTGACPAGSIKVFRLWNNRTDSNHRYTTDAAIKAEMVAKGYVAEGYGPDATIMCAPG